MNRSTSGIFIYTLQKLVFSILLLFSFSGSFAQSHSVLKSTRSGDKVQLAWQADSADHYIIEHSTDGTSFKTIGLFRASAKNSSYVYDAEPVKGLNIFRLKLVYKNDSCLYSNTIEFYSGARKSVTVFPNPSSGRLTVSHPMASGKEQVQVADMQGTVLYQTSVSKSAVHTTIDLSNLQKGTYNLIWNGEADKVNLKIFIQ